MQDAYEICYKAIEENQISKVKDILEKNPNLLKSTAEMFSYAGMLLRKAAKNENTEMLKLLIAFGAGEHINEFSRIGDTPLTEAIANRCTKNVLYLINLPNINVGYKKYFNPSVVANVDKLYMKYYGGTILEMVDTYLKDSDDTQQIKSIVTAKLLKEYKVALNAIKIDDSELLENTIIINKGMLYLKYDDLPLACKLLYEAIKIGTPEVLKTLLKTDVIMYLNSPINEANSFPLTVALTCNRVDNAMVLINTDKINLKYDDQYLGTPIEIAQTYIKSAEQKQNIIKAIENRSL